MQFSKSLNFLNEVHTLPNLVSYKNLFKDDKNVLHALAFIKENDLFSEIAEKFEKYPSSNVIFKAILKNVCQSFGVKN